MSLNKLDATGVLGLVPVKKHSVRIPNKNYADFDGVPLWEHKINQLIESQIFTQIFVGSDDEYVISRAEEMGCVGIFRSPIECDELNGSANIMIAELARKVKMALNAKSCVRNEAVAFWVHVTNPLVESSVYKQALIEYFNAIERGFDSLVSVTSVKNHAWFPSNGGQIAPLNFNPDRDRHQLASELEPLMFQNGALFVQKLDQFEKTSYFYGRRPFLYAIDPVVATDINDPFDLEIARWIWQNRNLQKL
jgi:CMP-N-acetylneuraminic acid synthetase